MATDAEILSVRKEAKLHGYEYFHDISGKKLELIKQQPPIDIISVEKNAAVMTLTSDYTFNDYRTITLTVSAIEADVFKIEYGDTVSNSEIGDIVDFSKEEIYGDLRRFYTGAELDGSTYVAELYKHLAAGYLIMKYWEGMAGSPDFWKHGRNWVDTVHKRCKSIADGNIQLVSSDSAVITKSTSPFQYKVLDHQGGLEPSEIYSQPGEDDVDDEVY